MQMQRTVRVLRIALPIAFIAFLALIGFTYTSNRIRTRPDSNPVTSPIRTGERPQSVAYLFEDTHTVGGKVFSKVRARRTMGFASGWHTLEDVELMIFRENRSYRLVAPQAQFHIETKAAEAKKGVKLTSSDGLAVQTEEMKFDGNRLSGEIPLTFQAQSWVGRAGGIDLSLQDETMRLAGGVEAVTQADAPGEPPVKVSSRLAEFAQRTNEVTFREDVTVTRGRDVLTTEMATGRFDQKRDVLVGLEGCCNVQVHLAGGSPLLPDELGKGAAQIDAERFNSELGPRGEIRAIVALGGPARGVFHGPPERNLTATSIRIGLAGERVSDIRTAGDVHLVEQISPGPRRLNANYVTVLVDPTSRAFSSALAEEHVRYRDPRSSATAQRAHYDARMETLLLTAMSELLPSLTTEGHILRATSIEVSQRDRVLRGQGRVSAQLAAREDSVSASDTALFPREEGPVFVNADSVLIRQADRVAVFSGNVRAWQGNNVLFASTLQVEAGGESLIARENVRAVLYNVRGEKRTKPIVARSHVLVARKSDRRIDLEGKVSIEDDPRTLTAEKATIFLDVNSRVERVEASTNLTVTEKSTGRKATGTHAVYRLTEKTLFLDGTPAVVTEPRGVVRGRQIVFDIAKNKVNVVSGDTPTEATYHPQ
jgi:lipopolysaccharide transport protein LptA